MDVKGYESLYQVSNFGNVKRLSGSSRCKLDRVLTLKTKKSGYKFVCLSENGRYKYFHVHRLVALTFLTVVDGKHFVNHKDMNKSNNHISNLEWVTAKENNTHARLNKTFKMKYKVGINNKSSIQVCQKNTSGDILYLWESARLASINYNVSQSCIAKACRLGTISIGYLWEYVDKDFYLKNKDAYLIAPNSIVENVRKRDLSKAWIHRMNSLKLITNGMLVETGCKCFYRHGRIIRKEYDIIAKENKTFTYIPTVKRFGSWGNFKKDVYNLISSINSPINNIKMNGKENRV